MRKAILFFYSLLFVSCACYYEDVRQEGEILNPTSYVYDFPEMEVRRVLDSCFALHGFQLPPDARKKYWEGLKSLVLLPCRDVLDSLGESKSCRFLNHQDTLYPVSFPLRSYVFKNRKGEFLWAYSEYILRIDSIARNKTKIAVFSHEGNVTVGRKLGFNPVSNGLLVSRLMEATSTTIEEYEILKYIGNKLGQKGMPPIHYPKALTREEILEHFYNGFSLSFPFTEKDIYGW